MAISSKSSTRYQIRSISLPCRSHPATIGIEEQLNKLKTWQAPSSMPMEQTIYSHLTGLVALYKCVEELLNRQPPLRHNQNENKLVNIDEVLDGSVRLLDICGSTRDLISQIKEHVRDLQCALRRRKGDVSFDSSCIAKYFCFRNKMKKDAKGLIASLRQLADYDMIGGGGGGGSPLADQDPGHITAVIRVLMEVREMTVSIFESLLLFFSVPVLKPKPNKWSLVSKLMHKGTVAFEDQRDNVNHDLVSLDASLFTLCSTTSRSGSSEEGAAEKMQIAQNRLEVLEDCTERFENGLECLFRRLIRTRAFLLNLASQ